MKIKVLIGLFFLLLFLVIALTTAMVRFQEVYQVSNGKIISFEQMISDVRKADFIVVGEVHDDPDDHRLELEIIKALHETDVPLAIGLEMFKADSQRPWMTGFEDHCRLTIFCLCITTTGAWLGRFIAKFLPTPGSTGSPWWG